MKMTQELSLYNGSSREPGARYSLRLGRRMPKDSGPPGASPLGGWLARGSKSLRDKLVDRSVPIPMLATLAMQLPLFRALLQRYSDMRRPPRTQPKGRSAMNRRGRMAPARASGRSDHPFEPDESPRCQWR
jgi:hypothetical protein